MFTSLFPIVSTPDLARAVRFWTEVLEARVVYRFPGEGDPVFVSLDLGSSHLGLAAAPDGWAAPRDERIVLWLYAEDCDAAVERLRAGGATVVEEPADQPWGERVARVLDADGTVLMIGA